MDEDGAHAAVGGEADDVEQNDDKYTGWQPLEHAPTNVVYMGRCVADGREVIKKVARYAETGQGVPYHIVREVSILKGIDHPNVVKLIEVVHKEDDVSLVYEFLPHDLRQLLDIKRDWLKELEKAAPIHPDFDLLTHPAIGDKQMKGYFRQVLEGVSFLHSRCILHRDLKPTDLRIDATNTIKISNFRLARTFTLPLRTYTHEVVTLWYRAPEILLGQKRYDTSIDMWSAGCILAEIITGNAIFMGDSEIDQLYHIFRLLGTPTPAVWPKIRSLPDYKATFPDWPSRTFTACVKGITPEGEDLISNLLAYDSSRRLTARRALSHEFFEDVKDWVGPTTRPEPPPKAPESTP